MVPRGSRGMHRSMHRGRIMNRGVINNGGPAMMLGRRIFAPESFALHNIPSIRNMINSPTNSLKLRFGQKRS
jgi:hypothetical protein